MRNDTQTLSLTDFLLARYAEDYEVAWGAEPSPWSEGKWDGEFAGPREVLGRHGDVTAVCYYGGTYGHVLRFDPTRVLKDIEAKRRIIEAAWDAEVVIEGEWGRGSGREAMSAAGDNPVVLELLALPYADHPDYRQEWKP